MHARYLEVGSSIVTANTYATNRNVTEPAGHGERTVEAIHAAVNLAREARDAHVRTHPSAACFVAGSLSTHPPALPPGSESSAAARYPEPEVEEANYLEAALAIRDAGVDFLMLEMMKVHRTHPPII